MPEYVQDAVLALALALLAVALLLLVLLLQAASPAPAASAVIAATAATVMCRIGYVLPGPRIVQQSGRISAGSAYRRPRPPP